MLLMPGAGGVIIPRVLVSDLRHYGPDPRLFMPLAALLCSYVAAYLAHRRARPERNVGTW
jgi:hypothetical protein